MMMMMMTVMKIASEPPKGRASVNPKQDLSTPVCLFCFLSVVCFCVRLYAIHSCLYLCPCSFSVSFSCMKAEGIRCKVVLVVVQYVPIRSVNRSMRTRPAGWGNTRVRKPGGGPCQLCLCMCYLTEGFDCLFIVWIVCFVLCYDLFVCCC